MEVKATVTLEKARTLIAKLDDWLCAPSGGRRCSPKQIEEFLEEIVILPRVEPFPDSLPYLADYSLKKRLERGTSDIADPRLRQVVVTNFIYRKLKAPQFIAEEMATCFLLLET